MDAVIDFVNVLKCVPKVPDVQMDTIICEMATAFSHYLGQKNFTEKQTFLKSTHIFYEFLYFMFNSINPEKTFSFFSFILSCVHSAE